MMVFSGNANLPLAESVCKHLQISLGKAVVSHFSDGEILVEILDHVRGREVFVLQSICAPSNDHLMELVIISDALRRASAGRITAVVPYFGYARQDRRIHSARVPITAKVVADMLAGVGVSRLLTVDLHADQIQGFFNIPVDNIYATPLILEDIQKKNLDNLLVVSPDVGGVARARAVAKRLNDTDMAFIDKRRTGPNKTEVMHLIGEVKGRHCLLIDDIVDTGGTICLAAQAMKARGAISVIAFCTHPVLSGSAVESIADSSIDEVIVTDTIPLSDKARKSIRIRQLSLSSILAEAIDRVNGAKSVSSMFNGNT